MSAKRLGAVVLILAGLLAQTAYSQIVRTVTKDPDHDGPRYTTIQAAVDAARPNDIVEIIDLSVYAEQVTIDSTKGGLTIRSLNPTAREKPVIRWQDVTNRDPLTSTAAQTPGNRSTFEECGALRILRAANITIDGIRISGGGAAPFTSPDVWCTRSANGTFGAPCHPLTHGNAAIAIVVAGGAVIRNCDLDSAYFGIAVKDRNIGGVFANPNPGDVDVTVPLSGFGKTGNHLFEYNRINRNSVGIYFESSWDLGSTVRYNLIYNNFHQPGTVVRQTNNNATTQVGTNGIFTGATGADDFGAAAISFKDNFLSPVAIYNNTLYNNHMNFLGNWQVGAQHLLFNNILSRVSSGSQAEPSYRNLIKNFPNRMHHTVMSAYQEIQRGNQNYQPISYSPLNPPGGCVPSEAIFVQGVQMGHGLSNPTATSTRLENVQGCYVNGANVVRPGAPVPGAGSEVRWLQTEGHAATGLPNLFQSVDPTNPNFLHPIWTNADVQSFIAGKGWPAYGAQGSPPDIGAIQQGGRNNTIVRILPSDVVMVSGTTAEARFAVNVENGTFDNATVRAIRWIQPIPATGTGNWFGESTTPIPATSIRTVTVPTGTTINTRGGTNVINFTIPAPSTEGTQYGFFEIVLEGTDASGNRVTSDVGFLPFRTLQHRLRIVVLPLDGMTPLTEVNAGQPVRLHITPLSVNPQGVETPWQGTLDQLALSLLSDPLARLYHSTTHQEFMYTNTLGPGANVFPVYFTKKTEETVGGSATAVIQGVEVVFRGSVGVRVKAGTPAKVSFRDPFPRADLEQPPGSGTMMPAQIINPGAPRQVRVLVTDQWDNPVDVVVPMSLTPEGQSASNAACVSVLNIVTPTANTDTDPDPEREGIAVFEVAVGCGMRGDWYDMKAEIASGPGVGAHDFGRLRVGATQDRLYTFLGGANGDPVGTHPNVLTNRDDIVEEYYRPEDAFIDELGGTMVPLYVRVVSGGAAKDQVATVCLRATDPQIEFYRDVAGAPGTEKSVESIVIDLNARGEGTVWITANADVDACIQTSAVIGDCDTRDIAINNAPTRCNVRFSRPSGSIERGEVFSVNNGNGIPDSMIVYFGGEDVGANDRWGDGGTWTSVPERVSLTWPADVGGVWPSAVVTVERELIAPGVYNIEPLAGDPTGRLLKVVFRGNVTGDHRPGYTSILGGRDMLGSLYWNGGAPGTDGWADMPFPIVERIGPVISEAGDVFDGGARQGPIIVENIARIQDTLMIEISEELAGSTPTDVPALIGSSIVHRNGEGAEINITVATATRSGNRVLLALAPGVFHDIQEGHFVRFNPAHPITDLPEFGSNPVSSLNRWVPVSMRAIPAELISESSFYVNDPNLSGGIVNQINYVQFKLSKHVELDWFRQLTLVFPGVTGLDSAVCVTPGAVFSVPGMEFTYGINLTTAFPNAFGADAIPARNLTSGDMRLNIAYDASKTDWSPIGGAIYDKASPVLVSSPHYRPDDERYQGAVLRVGAQRPGGTASDFELDTLVITFSERLDRGSLLVTNPLIFERTDGASVVSINPTLTPLESRYVSGRGIGWHEVTYIVPEGAFNFTVGNQSLAASDSVYINPAAGIMDSIANIHNGGNIQNGDPNRKIPIRIENKVNWGVWVKNNPFKAGSHDRNHTTVTFSPGVKEINDIKLTVKIMLYDNMGNLVESDEYSSTNPPPVNSTVWEWKPDRGMLDWTWRGYNKRKRLVGSGTYHLKAVLLIESQGLIDRTTEVRAIGFIR